MNSFISNFFPFTFCSLFLENLLFGCCIWGTIPPSSLIFSLLFFILWSFVLLSRKVSSWSTYASIGFLISAIMVSFFFFKFSWSLFHSTCSLKIIQFVLWYILSSLWKWWWKWLLKIFSNYTVCFLKVILYVSLFGFYLLG